MITKAERLLAALRLSLSENSGAEEAAELESIASEIANLIAAPQQ